MDGTCEESGIFLPKLVSISGSGRAVLMSAKGTHSMNPMRGVRPPHSVFGRWAVGRPREPVCVFEEEA